MFWVVTDSININKKEIQREQGRKRIEPLVVPFVDGVDVDWLQDSALVSNGSSTVDLKHVLDVSMYVCPTFSAGCVLNWKKVIPFALFQHIQN